MFSEVLKAEYLDNYRIKLLFNSGELNDPALKVQGLEKKNEIFQQHTN
jgi:hypothetical protein